MIAAVTLYDVVLFVHVAAVVVALGTIFTYPLLFAMAAATPAHRAGLHAFQARYGRTYASYGLLVVVLAGAYLASARDLWAEPWVGGPLLIAVVIGGLSGGFLAPRERRLAELSEADGADGAAGYARTLRQVKLAGGLASVLVLVAIFLMVTKPGA